jgi:hypothetical protein
MGTLSIYFLKLLRRIYLYINPKQYIWNYVNDSDIANDMIYDMLKSGKACMIARFGSNELNAIVNYFGVKYTKHSVLEYIKDKSPMWWWNKETMQLMQTCAGFFPITKTELSKFGELMLCDSKQVDILGSWRREENILEAYFTPGYKKVRLLYLEPFFNNNPWTRVLEGKRVLVIHPFAKQIERQYKNKRLLLFNNQSVLPIFTLITIPAVQSIGGDCGTYKTWFDALDWMKSEMDKVDYDIALIGCGAYGFPLAAHAKRSGHQAVHIGGVLQLLFGIKGNRWENPHYGAGAWGKENAYNELFNQYWEYPDNEYKPKIASQVEGSCYWDSNK